MSCPVMGEPIVLPPGTIPDHLFASSKKASEPQPERRKALEEQIVPLTLAFSRNREDANVAESLVVAYRDFESSVKQALRYAVRTSNLEATLLLLQYDASFYDFVDEDFMNELVEEGCKANCWDCVQAIMRYTRKGAKALPEVEEVGNGEPERKALGEGYGALVGAHCKLLAVFTFLYGILLVLNSKPGAIAVPPALSFWIKVGGSRLPTHLTQVLAQALYLAVSVQSLAGPSALGIFLEGPLAVLLVALHCALSLACTARALHAALGDAVWSQRSGLTVVKVPQRIDVRALVQAKEDSARDLKEREGKGKGEANGNGTHAMPFGHPTSGSGGKCPFSSMWAGDAANKLEEKEGSTEEVKKEK